jgi:hypothetical protein
MEALAAALRPLMWRNTKALVALEGTTLPPRTLQVRHAGTPWRLQQCNGSSDAHEACHKQPPSHHFTLCVWTACVSYCCQLVEEQAT